MRRLGLLLAVALVGIGFGAEQKLEPTIAIPRIRLRGEDPSRTGCPNQGQGQIRSFRCNLGYGEDRLRSCARDRGIA